MSRHLYGHSILEITVECVGFLFFTADRLVADWRRR